MGRRALESNLARGVSLDEAADVLTIPEASMLMTVRQHQLLTVGQSTRGRLSRAARRARRIVSARLPTRHETILYVEGQMT
jgi:hypothetical protein